MFALEKCLLFIIMLHWLEQRCFHAADVYSTLKSHLRSTLILKMSKASQRVSQIYIYVQAFWKQHTGHIIRNTFSADTSCDVSHFETFAYLHLGRHFLPAATLWDFFIQSIFKVYLYILFKATLWNISGYMLLHYKSNLTFIKLKT